MSRRRENEPRIERIVVLRVIAGVVVLAFLAIIVKASLIAFGTPDRESARIDRMEQRALAPVGQ